MDRSIKWLGHASFRVTSATGKIIYIDPYIVDNPLCPINLENIKAANIVLVTHDHFDHVGDAVDIIKRTGATLVAQPETVGRMASESGLPAERVANFGGGMNIGATIVIDGIAITMTQAFHSSGTASGAGFIIKLEDGYTIYHTGDTGIFATMKILGELYPLDLALLPIGGAFTMDPLQAARALTLLNPRKVIPMHYKTWPLLEQSADGFAALAKKEAPGVEIVVLEPGQQIAL
jgi:L-ascorbate metabolism protein UlaG (beta-lactamase superfamily)